MALNPGASTIAASPSSMSRSLHAKTPQVEPARSPRSAALLAIEQGGWSAANYCHALGGGGRRSALARCCGRLFCADWSDASGSSPCARARGVAESLVSVRCVFCFCLHVRASLLGCSSATRRIAPRRICSRGARVQRTRKVRLRNLSISRTVTSRKGVARCARPVRAPALDGRSFDRKVVAPGEGAAATPGGGARSRAPASRAKRDQPAPLKRDCVSGSRAGVLAVRARAHARARAWIGVTLRSMHQAYSSLLRQLKAGEALYRTASAFTAYAADPSRQRSPARCLAAARADARARRDRRCDLCAGWKAPLRQGRRRRGSSARPARREPRIARAARARRGGLSRQSRDGDLSVPGVAFAGREGRAAVPARVFRRAAR